MKSETFRSRVFFFTVSTKIKISLLNPTYFPSERYVETSIWIVL